MLYEISKFKKNATYEFFTPWILYRIDLNVVNFTFFSKIYNIPYSNQSSIEYLLTHPYTILFSHFFQIPPEKNWKNTETAPSHSW